MVENLDDTILRESLVVPIDFPMKREIMILFSRYGYYNEEIAWKVSKAIPRTKLEGYERYNELLEIVETAIDLQWPLNKFIAGKRALSVETQKLLSASILCYLEKNLCKWYSDNFKYLVAFSVKECRNIRFSDMPLSVSMNQQHLLFLMHRFLEERFSGDYFKAPKEKFHEAVSDTYEYIKNHLTEMPIIGCSESIIFGLWHKDLDLYEVSRNLINYTTYNSKKDCEAGKRKLRQMWSYWLGQGAISVMLDEMAHAIYPVYPNDKTDLAADVVPEQYLPYPIDSPQYRYVKELHQVYQESFSESFLTPPTVLNGELHVVEENHHEPPEWGHAIESKYLITQYLYYCLTGDLIAPEGGGHSTLLALIFDLLVLFGYRNDLDESEDDLDDTKDINRLRREKKGLVKHFLSVDRATGIYKRIQ